MNDKPDRAAKARAVLMRRAEEKKAASLRERGWTCIPPEERSDESVAPADSHKAPEQG